MGVQYLFDAQSMTKQCLEIETMRCRLKEGKSMIDLEKQKDAGFLAGMIILHAGMKASAERGGSRGPDRLGGRSERWHGRSRPNGGWQRR